MNAQLIDSGDEHHWVLLEHRVTQLLIEPRMARLQAWSLEGSVDVRLLAPFVLRNGAGVARTLDPARAESLAPALALVGLGVRSVTVTRAGTLLIVFGDSTELEAAPDARGDSWDVQGAGLLEGMSYRSVLGMAAW